MSERNLWITLGIGAAAMVCCVMMALSGAVGWFYLREVRTVGRVATPSPVVESTLRPRATTVPEAPTRSIELPPTWTPIGGATALPATPAPEGTATAVPPIADVPVLDPAAPLADLSLGLAPSFRSELDAHPDVPLYRIRARFDPTAREIVGQQWVRWTNREEVPLNEIYLRLYPNASHYIDGNLAVTNITISGQPITPVSEVEDTALRLPLPAPLAPGGSIEMRFDFVLTIPLGGGYGILGDTNGIFSLYNWHPEVAVYEEGQWLINPVSSQGDPTNTDIANYEAEIAAPSGWRFVTSGVEQEEGTITKIVAPLTRNLVLVASDKFEEKSRTEGEITVNSYYRSDHETGGQTTLDVTAGSISVFSDRFGRYPYAEMDAAEVGLSGGAAGMEATGLILIGSTFYTAEGDPLAGVGHLLDGVEIVPLLDHIVAHEVAHQWWYGLVGSDAFSHPWLDESLTNWSSAIYFDQARGEGAGDMVRDMYIGVPYYLFLQDGSDQVLDQTVLDFNEEGYGAIVYGKGSIMYDALRIQLGDEKFFDFIGRYYERYRFGRSTPEGWRATLAEVMGEAEATAFFDKWVKSDTITVDDLPPPGPMGQIFLNGGLFGP